MLYNNSIEEIRKETGLNVVGWSANNKGNGDCNLHVAILKSGAERRSTFKANKDNGDVITHAFTSHWHGVCSINKIKAALGI